MSQLSAVLLENCAAIVVFRPLTPADVLIIIEMEQQSNGGILLQLGQMFNVLKSCGCLNNYSNNIIRIILFGKALICTNLSCNAVVCGETETLNKPPPPLTADTFDYNIFLNRSAGKMRRSLSE